jgi:small subunit ribosomal protein S1
VIQERRDHLKPWEEPLEEEYWLALLQQGEAEREERTAPVQDASAPALAQPEAEAIAGLQSPPPEPQAKAPGASPVDKPGWEQAQDCMDRGQVLTLSVVEHNKGGLIVDWEGCYGFVPASHLASLDVSLSEEERQRELAALVGTELALKIIELDRDRNRLIFSEKATLVEDKEIEDLLNDICPGDVLEGRVTNLCSFGAFVDLGGVEGLVHISELSWGRVDHPSNVLAETQEIKVYVLNVDRDKRRIGLSLKRLQADPWNSLEERYRAGELVEGEITNVVSFGAFVRVEEGVEGLIHVSELAEGDLVHPRSVVSEGDTVTVRVLNIDSVNHRMGLSLRQVGGENSDDLGEDTSPD